LPDVGESIAALLGGLSGYLASLFSVEIELPLATHCNEKSVHLVHIGNKCVSSIKSKKARKKCISVWRM